MFHIWYYCERNRWISLCFSGFNETWTSCVEIFSNKNSHRTSSLSAWSATFSPRRWVGRHFRRFVISVCFPPYILRFKSFLKTLFMIPILSINNKESSRVYIPHARMSSDQWPWFWFGRIMDRNSDAEGFQHGKFPGCVPFCKKMRWPVGWENNFKI